eukprot:TRINITY_DN542_c0_g3_i2.p1 TRINITY_DN542_c0_g3~~TRINITY_DN542_c0_g3_i2.p1  ORF type:complete len:500 (+),score=249.90 TRINITY_DN542_c0_g3_i2:60-1502(+)
MAVKTYSQFIDGAFEAVPAELLDVENPSTHELLSKVPKGTAADAEKALAAAKKAQPEWEATPAASRGKVLAALATLIRQHRVRLAETLAKEQAKIMALAQIEIDVSADYLDYHNGMARTYEGEIVNSDNKNEHIYVHRLPIGVSVGVCPWNFPVFVMMRKIAPALVTGNTVVVKSSEFTPNTCFEVAALFNEAGVPKGVVNVVTGLGSVIGPALTASPVPGIISMTGSVATGQAIMRAAAANMTKVSLELGGKAPCVVMEDADLELAANAIHASRICFTGQVCNCAERVYVQESVAEKFTALLVKKMQETKVGLPTDEGVEMCGLVNKDQLEKVSGMVERAVKAGATVLCGGKKNAKFSAGYHFEPTVLTNVKQTDEIIQQEVFGPVLPIMTFKTFDEAMALSNDCEFGLASSIFTTNANTVAKAMTSFKFGETYINRFHFEAIQGFHAGWRKSGLGGADGKHGLHEYLATRVVYWQHQE